MKNSWNKALGDPQKFLDELTLLASRFCSLAKVEQYELKDIRSFVKARNYDLTSEPEVFRATVAAFAVVLKDYYAQSLRVRWLFHKKLMVESKRFRCELLDLFNRCVFEGLDLAPEGEVLAS